jgi:hypothetical protein
MLRKPLGRVATETPFAIALVVGNRVLMPLDRAEYWRSRGDQDDGKESFL